MENKKPQSSSPPWTELPSDVTANILHRLGSVDILENAQKVCTNWWAVCKDRAMWRVVDMKTSRKVPNLGIMCRHAVYRSQGELSDISIEHFGSDQLLRFISDRSCKLRRLRLAFCSCISGKGLAASVKNFPQLEELQLFFMPFVTAEDIDGIGISCPMLKSFTFENCGYRYLYCLNDNTCALTVAKTMPDLQHLGLFGNSLDREGVQAILNGCPHLESLDLRQCFGVDLEGDFGRMCYEQIKDLRGPHDSRADYDHGLFPVLELSRR